MRTVAGVDLNGVRDALARRLPEDEDDVEEVDLGIRGGLIRLQSIDGQWLGGSQVARAPHGRGGGWGRIGADWNRVDLLDGLGSLRAGDPDPILAEALPSALPGMIGEDCELAVFAVPDAPDYGEAVRERLLLLLRRTKGLRPLLLWRPVAAVLGWLAARPDGARDGLKAAVLSLMADGVHLSVLTLQREMHRGVPLFVPERSRAGAIVAGSFSAVRMIEAGRRWLCENTDVPERDIRASAMAPWRAAVGASHEFELIRMPDRGWRELPRIPEPEVPPDPSDLPDAALERLSGADLLLVEGPFAGNAAWRAAVVEALSERAILPPEIVPGEGPLVARGCLEAATRHTKGQPIYFDFLPQLQINAMVGNEPRFVDLIPRGARCRGGEPYRAAADGSYVIGENASRLTFWLFKEDLESGRRAEVELPRPADREYELSISVEQVPGQGFAQVRISSAEFDALRQAPITLDWTRMEETTKSREEILAELEGQMGLAWPDVAVQAGHPFLWLPEHPLGDLVEQLRAYRQTPLLLRGRVSASARELLQTLRTRFSRHDTPSIHAGQMGIVIEDKGSFRALDSDGALPAQKSGLRVPEDAELELDATLTKLEEDMLALQHQFGQGIDSGLLGDVLGFASWCFWRCPSSIVNLFLDTYAGEADYNINPTLLREGAARVVSRPEQIARYFSCIERRLAEAGGLVSAEYAGIGRVLRTSEEAAAILPGSVANRVLQQTVADLSAENGVGIAEAYRRRFKAALLMLAALLRHRKVSPVFLKPDQAAATQLLRVLQRAEQRNLGFAATREAQAALTQGGAALRHRAAARRFAANAGIIAELKDFIRLQGHDPNIIRRIDAIDDSDGDGNGAP